MEGLVKEGAEVMAEDLEEAVMDAGLIGAARRVEQYEIAAYGAVSELRVSQSSRRDESRFFAENRLLKRNRPPTKN
jgi:ferritin-like metal-binding protein YciE